MYILVLQTLTDFKITYCRQFTYKNLSAKAEIWLKSWDFDISNFQFFTHKQIENQIGIQIFGICMVPCIPLLCLNIPLLCLNNIPHKYYVHVPKSTIKHSKGGCGS